jgi:multidrug efflux pump subunit AcrA (membrane-fusion protein)
MAYEATAELYKRQYDLAKKRAQSEYDSAIGDLATQYRQANLDLEANLEGRGILRSGEGMRGRVRLGAAEKAAQLGAETARQGALDQAGLSYMQQLAELQAKGYKGGTPGTGGDGGGTGAGTGSGSSDDGSSSAGGENILGYPKEVWDKINWGALASSNVLPAPGGQIGGPDRKLSNGGAVVNGIYIPPGIDWGALAPQPVRPIRGAF